jgi:integrase
MKTLNRKKWRTAPPTLPELDQTGRSVLNSLTSLQSRRSYQHAMDEFIEWYCSEPRLPLNRSVVLRYRLHLEARKLAASTINVRLAAVRRLAYEAADSGLLSPELVAGIRRVKGVPQLGRRVGNWLSAAEGEQLLSGTTADTLRQKRDAAIISLLLGCGLRRSEVVALAFGDIQKRGGNRGSGRQGRTRTNSAGTRMGQNRRRSLDRQRTHRQWQTIPLDPKERNSMGQRYHPERHLVCRQGWRGPRWDHRVGAPRPEKDLRAPVSCRRRRIGADPIPVGPCLGPDHRTIHWMQAGSGPGSKRPAPLRRQPRLRPGNPVATAKGIYRQE